MKFSPRLSLSSLFLKLNVFFWSRLNIVSSDCEPGEAGECLNGLLGERPDLVIADADGVNSPCQAVSGNFPDMVVVQVYPQKPLEAAEEIGRKTDDLVVPKEQGCEGVPKAQEVAVGEGDDLVTETNKLQVFLSIEKIFFKQVFKTDWCSLGFSFESMVHFESQTHMKSHDLFSSYGDEVAMG